MNFIKIVILVLLLAFLSACTSTENGVTISNSSWFSVSDTADSQNV